MAKQRYIDTHFWRDSFISSLDPSEKLAFIHLLTNPDTTLSGIYELNIRIMAVETGIDVEMCKKIIARFQEQKKVWYIDGWIIIVNFPRHQNFEGRDKIKKAIDSQLMNVPAQIIKRIQSGEIPYTYHIDTIPNYSDLDLDSDFDSDRESAPAEPLPRDEKPADAAEPVKAAKFVKPTEAEVSAYLQERNITAFSAQKFIDYYESKGWLVGKTKMKCWKAAVRTWEQSQWNQPNARASPPVTQSPQDRAAQIRAAINE